MAAHDVLDNEDLLKLILKKLWDHENVNAFWDSSFMAAHVRQCLSIQYVNRLFRTTAHYLIDQVWKDYRRRMRRFDKCVDAYFDNNDMSLGDHMRALYLHGTWALWLYRFDVDMMPSEDLPMLMSNYLFYKRPETNRDLLDMLEHKCVCCDGDACKWIDPQGPSWVEATQTGLGAWMLHPYNGQIERLRSGPGCGCRTHVLQGQWLPHTHPDHFFEMTFMFTVQGAYKAQLHVYCEMKREERRAANFLLGARKELWYEPRIKRLFEMRPRILNDAKPCCDSWPTTCKRPLQFTTSICLLEPYMSNNADCSLQQIFGLTRAEALAFVRRGSGIRAERRRLHISN